MNAGRHKPVPSSTFSTSITSVLMRPLNTYWGPLMDLVLLVDFFPETLGRGGRRTAVTLGSGIEEMGGAEGRGGGRGGFTAPGSPGLPLAVDQQVVEQEEDALLDVAGGDLQQVAVQQQLRADVCQVGSLRAREVERKKKTTIKKLTDMREVFVPPPLFIVPELTIKQTPLGLI